MNKWEQIQNKIATQDEAKAITSSWKNNSEIVVFTNGCFDILHKGHVAYLAKAASTGDYLVVGVNSDKSVKRLKGESRPINDQVSRSLVLAALESVDLVVLFENDTPKELIEFLHPSILVKGADYDANVTDENDPKYIVGSKAVKEAGGTVITIELEEGYSTSNVISSIQKEGR
ncbi:MAG TPA: D-glycero-beta-D-manno-heptose 1-phosphate adenylyltransferase [Brumimicrobium sp.]|nr:D-glycero-beta-D-manno-heptose 1-phosphate adenylyltransferase [Brumimicrobium sp.]